MSMRPSGDTARGLVFDDFVDKQVVHVSATSFRSGAERVSMHRPHDFTNFWPLCDPFLGLKKSYLADL